METSTMKDRWWRWHLKNKHVYDAFEKQVYRAISAGKQKLSAYQIIEWIRWEVYMTTVGDIFRISNDWIPFYARYFVYLHPEHLEVFNFKSGVHVNEVNL